jgi:hypothetical protein
MAETARPIADETPKAEPPRASREQGSAQPRFLGLSPRQLAGLGAVVLAVNLPFLVYLTRGQAPVAAAVPFQDDFQRAEVGSAYWSTGGHWRIENGALLSPGVKNNPLWLKAALPADVAVEFDARGESSDGDIKCEIFGNGYDHASGYVIVFGGWSNSISVIARLDEHGRDRKESRAFKVEKGRTYHFRIERKGSVLRWLLDGQLVMEYDDPSPLRGRGHDRFGLSSWESTVFFDNLKVVPL